MIRHYLKNIFIGISILFIYTACSETVNIEEERDKEAEVYFMEHLEKEMNGSDILESNLTMFTTYKWDKVCFIYDKYDKYDEFIITFIDHGFLVDEKVYLDLSKYINIAKLYKNRIQDVDSKKRYKNIRTLCTDKETKFIISKVKNTNNKYIIDTRRIEKIKNGEKNEK